MKTLLSVLILSFSTVFVNAQSNVWMAVDSVNGPGKSVATSFVLSGEGYVVGGLTAQDFTRKMYSYSPTPNDWDDELSWGGETGSGQNRGAAVSFAIGNKAYVGLGQGNSALYYKDFWSYDPVTQTWTQLADFEGSARHGAVAFSNEDYGFVGTGQSENGLEKDFYRFDPTDNSWLQLNDFPGTARKFAAACMMGADGFLATGDDGVLKNDLWKYHTGTDSWVQLPNLPGGGRVGAVMWGTFPTLCVATGENGSGQFLNDVWEYSYWTNGWTSRASLPASGRTHATAFVINNIAYLCTGYNNGEFYDDCWAYYRVLGETENSVKSIDVYPNPTSDWIAWTKSDALKEIAVFDLSGNMVKYTSEIEERLVVSDLSQGTYTIEFRNSDGSVNFAKFIKE